LLNLLSAAFNNLFVFLIIFLVVNLGFMHSFCLAFGLAIKDFSDPYMTFFTLIRYDSAAAAAAVRCRC
jgi:hypothetical protein